MQRTERDPTPLHQRIRLALLRQVNEGVFKAGERIPAESALAAEFGVSRMTVRQALEFLVREGVLERRRGLGTYVARPRISQDLAGVYTMAHDFSEQGVVQETEVLSFVRDRARGYVARTVGVDEREPVYVLRRLVRVRQEPFALIISYLPVALVPGLDRYDFTARLLGQVLADEYGIVVQRQDKVIDAVLLGPKETALLEAGASRVGLRVQYRTLDTQLQVVEYRDMLLRGDMVRYVISCVPRDGRMLEFDDELAASHADTLAVGAGFVHVARHPGSGPDASAMAAAGAVSQPVCGELEHE